MAKDFYALLGLKNRNPSADELKSAYKKAAMKHHPDRNPKDRDAAEKRFKSVAEAYAVLSDPQKKQVYDVYGEEGLKQGPPPPSQSSQGGFPGGFAQEGFPGGTQFVFRSSGSGDGSGLGGIDPHDLFAQFFGGSDAGFTGGFGGADGVRSFNIGDLGGMAGMGGMGGIRGKRARHAAPSKPDQVKYDLGCTLEQLYFGATRKLKVNRELLDSNSGSTIKAEKVLQVDVQPGWKAGTKLTFKGEGDERPGKSAQDIVVVVKQKPHSFLQRHGDDLHFVAKVSAAQAAKGVRVTIPTLDGRKLVLEQPAGIKHKMQAPLRGEGMPTRSGGKGDMVVNFEIQEAANVA